MSIAAPICRVAAVALLSLAGLAPAIHAQANVPTPTTLLIRLGDDTLAIEQYNHSASHLEGLLLSRSPFVTIASYHIVLGDNDVPISAEFTLRRGDGTAVLGAMPSLSLRFDGDSVYLVGHRTTGDTAAVNAAVGPILPYVNGSYGLFELALAQLVATHRDSATFSLVPLNFNVRNTTPVPIRLLHGDSAVINWFGSPQYLRHDGRGHLLALDGRQSTIKVMVERVAPVHVAALGRAWTDRERTAGAFGPTSPRDTVTATIGGAQLWIDYGRPALRGRDVWRNGVLGDSIWRTGANAATQLRTDTDLLVAGQLVPAGTYSLWTQATRDGYHLIVNRQHGQWGTEYDPKQDLLRVPLRESTSSAPVEHFTIAITPQGAGGGTLALVWGTKALTVPIALR